MSFVLVGVFGPYISPTSTGTSKGRPSLVCVILGKVLTMGDDWTILISGITMYNSITMYNDSGPVSSSSMLRIRYKITALLSLVQVSYNAN